MFMKPGNVTPVPRVTPDSFPQLQQAWEMFKGQMNPKPKPQGQFQRVSPGMYRGPGGKLTRSTSTPKPMIPRAPRPPMFQPGSQPGPEGRPGFGMPPMSSQIPMAQNPAEAHANNPQYQAYLAQQKAAQQQWLDSGAQYRLPQTFGGGMSGDVRDAIGQMLGAKPSQISEADWQQAIARGPSKLTPY